jgi:hypothetical protein
MQGYNAKMFRIHTQSTSHDEAILDEVGECFAQYTAFQSTRCDNMKGQEDGLIIEILGTYVDRPLVRTLAESIKQLNKQTVLVTAHDVDFITIL